MEWIQGNDYQCRWIEAPRIQRVTREAGEKTGPADLSIAACAIEVSAPTAPSAVPRLAHLITAALHKAGVGFGLKNVHTRARPDQGGATLNAAMMPLRPSSEPLG